MLSLEEFTKVLRNVLKNHGDMPVRFIQNTSGETKNLWATGCTVEESIDAPGLKRAKIILTDDNPSINPEELLKLLVLLSSGGIHKPDPKICKDCDMKEWCPLLAEPNNN